MNRPFPCICKRFFSLLHFKNLKRSKALTEKPKNEVSELNKRTLHLSGQNSQMPKTPDLIYMPHFLRWVKSKLSFKYLKKIWDPEFSEGAFIYGTTQAVCRITEIINTGKVEELDELMTLSARIKLLDDINFRLTPTQKKLITLKPEDIKILVPITVDLNTEGPNKTCRVNLRILGLKWHQVELEHYRLVLVALQAEFLRDYGETATPEWIISGFNILDCAMLGQMTPSNDRFN